MINDDVTTKTRSSRRPTKTTKKIGIAGTALLLTGFLAALTGADVEPQKVTAEDIGSKVQVIGKLGKPMGTYVTIEGATVLKGPLLKKGLLPAGGMGGILVQKIDGEKLAEPILIDARSVYQSEGVHVEWRGYETGAFQGTPEDSPKNPKFAGPASSQPFHMAYWFEVTWATPGAELQEKKSQ